jgi:hypothetical protein
MAKRSSHNKSNTKHVQNLALVDQSVFRHSLLVVIHPCCNIRVGVCLNVSTAGLAWCYRERDRDLRIDIINSREVWRIASDVSLVSGLIDSNIVDKHICRKHQVLEVD